VTTLQAVELGVLGPLQVRQHGAPVAIPGAKPRAILTMLGLHDGSVVSADALVELLWGEDPPRTAAKALQTHISSLRRTLGDGFVLTRGAGWTLAESEVDASRYKSAARRGRDAATAGDTSQAVARFEEALALWRGIPELPDGRRGTSEKTRWIEGHAALVEDRADALLATGRAAEVIGDLEAAVAEAPLRERRWGQLMLALYRAGRQGEALGAYQRARSLLADELGVDPGPELRRLEAAIVAQDASLDIPVAQNLAAVTRAVTFFLTDIEGSTAAWEADANAMAVALARHDELVEQVVTSRGGRLIKTRGEGDATFSVFERPSAAAAAAIELQDAITHEPWALAEPMRVRVALHTGEAELRDGDYFGRAVNRAARLRSLAEGGQILCSGATAELVIDSLSDDVLLIDLGMRQLKNLPRPEHVFELRLEAAVDHGQEVPPETPIVRPSLPAVLAGPGPFVGRGHELGQLFSAWQTTLAGGTNAALIAGEPGVGKTRLAGEWSRQAYDQGALVIYGRCDEDLGAAYQPFAEALRSLVPCLDSSGLRGLRGVEALLALVPGLTDVLPDLAAPTRADPDTERYALFDAVVALLGVASASAPVVLILDDLHWAAKPTLLLLRHLLRFGDQARVQIVGTYRSTDLDRSHPLAAMLADLHRDGTANRIQLSGLDEKDVTAYVAEVGYDDEELARALASVTGGNPFFLIEALRHVEESGGHWDPSTLPQGVREAVTRRLSRLTPETNKALGAAAVVGSRFGLELVERVVGDDLVDAFDEACKAGIVIEEPGGNYRFNHALVRQSLLAELASVRRMRLHQRIAATLETQPGADDELLAELAYHYFECAWAGNAAKAVDYCRRAADQAMARLSYEGAADLYDRALHALEEIDEELPDRDDQATELMVARCEALLAAGDVTTAAGAVSQLQRATSDSARLAAWATCFDGELSMLINPERLDEIEAALGVAAAKLAELGDAAGEAKAHTVRASCLARLGRVGDCEIALDDALTAARRAGEHRRVNAVLAGAPLAALWGPNPVPRAGGRCLDVVRLLRITTDSPAVEATSTRCQAVLEAFRGRAEAARRMIDSARRTVTELGLRHALLEVEQFAGIVELVVDDPVAAEPHLRQAYNGFRRMGLDADTAETAALLGRACLALDQEAEADELCTESERLAGHALKPAMAWRMLRAQLLSRRGDHDEARRQAEAAVALAERTDALVDHGDACLALATVLSTAGDVGGSRAAAERAVDLYERKGAAALAEKAHGMLGERVQPTVPTPPEAPVVELRTAAVQANERATAAVDREDWDEFESLFAPEGTVESRRKVVGFKQNEFRSDEVMHQTRRDLETGIMRANNVVIAVRGERAALARVTLGTPDVSPGAPQDEFLLVYGIDKEGRIATQVWFDLDDMDAAIAELDATHARFEEEAHRQGRRLENAASQLGDRYLTHLAAGNWDAIAKILADGFSNDDRRRLVGAGVLDGRDAQIVNTRARADLWSTDVTSTIIATRGRNLALARLGFWRRDEGTEPFLSEMHTVLEINADNQIVALVSFDVDAFDAAFAELDARYLSGEAAAHAHAWSMIAESSAAFSRQEFPAIRQDSVFVDHRRAAAFGSTDLTAYISAGWELGQHIRPYIEAVHRLSDRGAVCSYAAQGISDQGFDAEWQGVTFVTIEGDTFNRCEFFDEADLDAALAKFDQLSRPTPRLENAATQLTDRFLANLAAGDWDALAGILADNFSNDDRRRLLGSVVLDGRDAQMTNTRAIADLWSTNATANTIATRGKNLALARLGLSRRDKGPDAWLSEAYTVLEINDDEQMVALVVFDLDDFDSAIAELDRRYLAGEAAVHAHTWSVVMQGFASLNRRELPPTTPDWVNIDHRRGTSIAPGEMPAVLGAAWKTTSDLSSFIEAVHRLDNLGAVITHVANETSQEGFHAEWRVISLLALDGDLVNRCEVFDDADLDTAIARFDELSRPAPRLENAASRVDKHFQTCFAARDWDAMAEMLSEGFSVEDRRRVVNAGNLHGRDAELTVHAYAAVGSENVTSTVIATRAQRLALSHYRFSGRDQRPDAFRIEMLVVVEIDAGDRMAAVVVFDVDDFDSAIAELDRRYLAGEAAAYARVWSNISGGFTSMGRYELPPTTSDCVSIDHRRTAAFAPGELNAYFRAAFDLTADVSIYVEAVHRLNDVGAVCTHVTHGVSHEGFDAEWREVDVLMVEGDIVNRCELFDEADLDVALAKFEELSRPARRLENAASEVAQRFLASFAARDWDAVAQLLADDMSTDDRRRVVNSGIQNGREANIANMRALADLGVMSMTSEVIATRGNCLALCRIGSAAFQTEVLNIVEIDADELIVAVVGLDLDDFEAAIAELDARYLAGEAASRAHTWSVIVDSYAAFNRRELTPTTPEWVNIDHRRGAAFAPGDMIAYLQAAWDDSPDTKIYIAAVHRLGKIGAVVTHVAHGISQEGFDAEWRDVHVLTVEGDMVSRSELFDEVDLDTAIARFDQLSQRAPRLHNAASRLHERFLACFAAGDWDAIAEIMAEDFSHDDRRPVVGTGVQHGRDAYIVDVRAVAELWNTNLESTVVAIRGERLVLMRNRLSDRDEGPEAFSTEVLAIGEIDASDRGVAVVTFDVDDIDAALAELDARYIAGEAAAHARTWSVITQAYSAVNRREMPPTTPDWVNIDHRRGVSFGPGELPALLASWNLAPYVSSSIEVVHRLNNYGAVVTSVSHETSQEGVNAEWRVISLLTAEGDLINRAEFFDEEDIDAAIARFDQLSQRAPRPENAASQAIERFQTCFAARDWDAMAEMMAEDVVDDDRRRVVNAGVRRGRDAAIANMQAVADIGAEKLSSTFIATRGERLVLRRQHVGNEKLTEAFQFDDVLQMVEIDADERLATVETFDLDDIDTAIAELDSRYLAGEAATHAQTWSVVAGGYAALNRHEVPPSAPDYVNIDHRLRATFEAGDLGENLRTAWDLTPDLKGYIEAVHRLTALGAVVTYAAHGTSQEGLDAEWRTVHLLTLEAGMVNRCEVFDEADLDAALTRFEELSWPTTRLENTASRMVDQFFAHFGVRDWDAMTELLADDVSSDDRRGVVNAGIRRGRELEMANWRATEDMWTINVRPTVAIRGERLVLVRFVFTSKDVGPEAFSVGAFAVVEINDDNQIAEIVVIEPEDIDAAFAELDARYLAGEASAHLHTWSVISRAFAALNQHELPPTTPGWVNIDHRSTQRAEEDDLGALIRATWDVVPYGRVYIEAVHRLNDIGVVITYVARGTSQEGFDAEWRAVNISTVDSDMVSRSEIFDEADIDAALARFDQLSRRARRLENAASRLHERFLEYYAAGDSQAMAEMLADNYSSDDRRRVVGSGVRHGRDAHIADMRARAELWNTNLESTVMAIRGERLALMRIGLSDRDEEPEAFSTEVLAIGEIGADERLVATVTFDLDEIDAAIAELDARYLAGEGAAHAHAWSVITRGYAAFNRRELPQTTQDWVSIDHRRAIAFSPSQLIPYMQATWDMAPDINTYIEAAHRLSNLGAVVAQVSRGTSQQGFDGEWREIILVTVEGDLINRIEIFDEADVDAALARFDELQTQARRVENAATQVTERFLAQFAAGDWDAMPKMMADNFSSDDRRRVVGAGVRHGRNAQIMDMRAIADLGITHSNTTHLATRGKRLALSRIRMSSKDQPFYGEMLDVLEINADAQIVKYVVFDPDDVDAAFEELDARYLAGEGAAHAHTWTVVAGSYAGFNRHELPATTPDWIYIDHRPLVTIEANDLPASMRAIWDLAPEISIYIEAVHRLSDLGAVVTAAVYGTSREGFEAEWRMIDLFTVEGDLFNRSEIFDEADLDAALTRFEELSRPTRLENAATRTVEQFFARFRVRDWDAMGELLADDVSADDRRLVVNAGIRRGRDLEMANWRATDDLWTISARSNVATRGERLTLVRLVFTSKDGPPQAFSAAGLAVVEIDDSNRIARIVAIEPDDLDAAFAELDAQYLAGEAAAHALTWSVIVRAFAALNQHELPATTPSWVNIDHRSTQRAEADDLTALIRATWEVVPRGRVYIEAVHRLNDVGVVTTYVARGTSQEGFAAEWRAVNISTVDGDMVSRSEVFDEADLDAALARFDELHAQARRPGNAASHLAEHFLAYFAARDWDAMAEVLADNFSGDDRRRVVGSGIRHGRDAQIADMRAIADLGTVYQTPTVLATRGERIALVHHRLWFRDQGPEGFLTDVLVIGEINADGQIVAAASFDLDDIDAAFAELDTRYLAGEAAAHARAWSAIAAAHAEVNRHKLPATTPDPVYIDHRPLVSIEGADLAATLRAVWDITPAFSVYIEAVHRLDEFGAVATQVLNGTSQAGLDAEWRMIDVFTVEGDLMSRVEVFEEADLDSALARFDELHPQAPRLENAASQVEQRFMTYFGARDWDAYAEILSDDVCMDDRRHVVNAGVRHGRDAEIASQRAVADVGVTGFTSTVIAIRGRRLALGSYSVFDGWSGSTVLCVSEINAENQIVARVAFDPDDIDAAFEELEARYLAGEAAAHSHTWSFIAQTYAAFNRREVPATTPDWVTIDHRPVVTSEAADLGASIRAVWDLIPSISIYIEAVHRLSELGAVVTQALKGTSQEGFDAEWRMIDIYTVEGDLLSRSEIFDEADLDAALARFEELQPQTSRLENAASQAVQRFWKYFAAREWAALTETMAEDFYTHDRRGVVNAGELRGRAVHVTNMRAVAEVGFEGLTSTVIAAREKHLALIRVRSSVRGSAPGEVTAEMLSIVEIDADNLLTAAVIFDPDDIDAAIEELDVRYLAGEAAAHAHTWSVMMQACAALNTREIFATTADFVDIDHRSLAAIGSGDLKAYIREALNDGVYNVYIEAVHRLGDLGAVVTLVSRGISQEGFDGEWRMADVFTVEGDLISRCEIFNEADLDAALARFDELRPPAGRLENAAIRVSECLFAGFAAGEWDSIRDILAEDFSQDDRRRVVGAGVRHGRDQEIADLRAAADLWTGNATPTYIATRGERLVLMRLRLSFPDQGSDAFFTEVLGICEITADERIVAAVLFEFDDIDAAFQELDARYLAGEAAAHAHTWSVIMQACAALNRRELPARTADFVDIDHRSLAAIASGDLKAYIREALNDGAYNVYIEAVHRLSDLGAVITQVSNGTSQEGFDGEWRTADALTVEGDQISRCEIFDEADLDAAIARFDELARPSSS
jgi:DNA-binding SARP family transcriptional activator